MPGDLVICLHKARAQFNIRNDGERAEQSRGVEGLAGGDQGDATVCDLGGKRGYRNMYDIIEQQFAMDFIVAIFSLVPTPG